MVGVLFAIVKTLLHHRRPSRLALPRLAGNTCTARLVHSERSGAEIITAFAAPTQDGLAAGTRDDRGLTARPTDDFGLD
jgi:hypothetical protein